MWKYIDASELYHEFTPRVSVLFVLCVVAVAIGAFLAGFIPVKPISSEEYGRGGYKVSRWQYTFIKRRHRDLKKISGAIVVPGGLQSVVMASVAAVIMLVIFLIEHGRGYEQLVYNLVGRGNTDNWSYMTGLYYLVFIPLTWGAATFAMTAIVVLGKCVRLHRITLALEKRGLKPRFVQEWGSGDDND